LEGKAMRKDDEEEIPAAKEEIKKAEKEAEELSDEALLGEATLKRLAEQEDEDEE
jgi:hypothetical protein